MTKKPKVDFYRDAKREWRWRVRAKNGRILADSGEGYKRRSEAERGLIAAFDTVQMNWPN